MSAEEGIAALHTTLQMDKFHVQAATFSNATRMQFAMPDVAVANAPVTPLAVFPTSVMLPMPQATTRGRVLGCLAIPFQ